MINAELRRRIEDLGMTVRHEPKTDKPWVLEYSGMLCARKPEASTPEYSEFRGWLQEQARVMPSD